MRYLAVLFSVAFLLSACAERRPQPYVADGILTQGGVVIGSIEGEPTLSEMVDFPTDFTQRQASALAHAEAVLAANNYREKLEAHLLQNNLLTEEREASYRIDVHINRLSIIPDEANNQVERDFLLRLVRLSDQLTVARVHQKEQMLISHYSPDPGQGEQLGASRVSTSGSPSTAYRYSSTGSATRSVSPTYSGDYFKLPPNAIFPDLAKSYSQAMESSIREALTYFSKTGN